MKKEDFKLDRSLKLTIYVIFIKKGLFIYSGKISMY